MALPVVYRLRVKYDLGATFDWYEEQRSVLGGEFRTSVRSTFKAIELHPELLALVHGEVRHAIVSRFPFAVFDLVEPKRLVVLRVLHSAQFGAVAEASEQDPLTMRSRADARSSRAPFNANVRPYATTTSHGMHEHKSTESDQARGLSCVWK